jgi:hypothetical protein
MKRRATKDRPGRADRADRFDELPLKFRDADIVRAKRLRQRGVSA